MLLGRTVGYRYRVCTISICADSITIVLRVRGERLERSVSVDASVFVCCCMLLCRRVRCKYWKMSNV